MGKNGSDFFRTKLKSQYRFQSSKMGQKFCGSAISKVRERPEGHKIRVNIQYTNWR